MFARVRSESSSGGASGPRRFRQAVFACSAVVLLFIATLIYDGSLFGAKLTDTANYGVTSHSQLRLGFYDWTTRSQFKPVSQTVAGKSIQELCSAFPRDLLREIQPILKTGNGVLGTRVKTHLESVSACLGSNLLIFSDLDAEINDYHVIDALSDLRADFVYVNDQLESYVLQKVLAESETLETEAASRVKGWKTDKFKFLSQVSRAWRMRPKKKWYVSYEDDTYFVWDKCPACPPISTPTCRGTLAFITRCTRILDG
jgi:hypothetical protein